VIICLAACALLIGLGYILWSYVIQKYLYSNRKMDDDCSISMNGNDPTMSSHMEPSYLISSSSYGGDLQTTISKTFGQTSSSTKPTTTTVDHSNMAVELSTNPFPTVVPSSFASTHRNNTREQGDANDDIPPPNKLALFQGTFSNQKPRVIYTTDVSLSSSSSSNQAKSNPSQLVFRFGDRHFRYNPMKDDLEYSTDHP
jgi:hypothetical protein